MALAQLLVSGPRLIDVRVRPGFDRPNTPLDRLHTLCTPTFFCWPTLAGQNRPKMGIAMWGRFTWVYVGLFWGLFWGPLGGPFAFWALFGPISGSNEIFRLAKAPGKSFAASHVAGKSIDRSNTLLTPEPGGRTRKSISRGLAASC